MYLGAAGKNRELERGLIRGSVVLRMPPISKSTFLQFQICPKDTWLKLYKPELAAQFKPTEFELHLMQQGNEVEAVARRLWPDAVLVTSSGEEACRETERLMANGATIFQATFVVDGFLAKCDVLAPAGDAWDIYEIKGTNSKKEGSEDRDHISDLAFQANLLTWAGVKIGRTFIVHLNKEYVRHGELDIEALFVKDDSTEQVNAVRPDIAREMGAAKEYLGRAEEPGIGCDCHLKGRSRQCATFAYSHPHIPEYSVHDIVRIGQSKKKILYFMDERIYTLDDVPEDCELGEAQANQVRTHKDGAPIVDEAAIAAELASYSYPLYFFDYETFAPAIPAFDDFAPYQRIPFQFSLHVLRAPGSMVLEHIEFLHEELSDPTARVAELLAAHIEPKGSVVVWYAPFERGVNNEIAKRLPQYASAIARINGQIRDLREIFARQHYVHPDFRGSTSIKAVLPVLTDISYDDLAIREGGSASEEWWKMVAPGTAEAARCTIAANLRAYCERDTYAMYAIWKKLAK